MERLWVFNDANEAFFILNARQTFTAVLVCMMNHALLFSRTR